jgi:hypothetical protein
VTILQHCVGKRKRNQPNTRGNQQKGDSGLVPRCFQWNRRSRFTSGLKSSVFSIPPELNHLWHDSESACPGWKHLERFKKYCSHSERGFLGFRAF